MLQINRNEKENINQDVNKDCKSDVNCKDKQVLPGDDSIMFFDTDDDFYQFCIDPSPKFNTDDIDAGLATVLSYTYDFTKSYYDAIADGIKFVIKDPKSVISKHGSVHHRLINKPVQNLEPYHGEGFYTDLED